MMESILKNKKELIIREATIEDAEQLRITIKEYVEESEFVPYIAGEYKLTVEKEREWIQSFIDQENSILLLALVDNKIVGNITVNGTQREVLKHVGVIGIGMLKEYRGFGIGSALFQATLDWAKENPIIEHLSLETYHTNIMGMKLYKKFGFEIVGKQDNYIKISETEYADNVIMTLKIK